MTRGSVLVAQELPVVPTSIYTPSARAQGADILRVTVVNTAVGETRTVNLYVKKANQIRRHLIQVDLSLAASGAQGSDLTDNPAEIHLRKGDALWADASDVGVDCLVFGAEVDR